MIWELTIIYNKYIKECLHAYIYVNQNRIPYISAFCIVNLDMTYRWASGHGNGCTTSKLYIMVICQIYIMFNICVRTLCMYLVVNFQRWKLFSMSDMLSVRICIRERNMLRYKVFYMVLSIIYEGVFVHTVRQNCM